MASDWDLGQTLVERGFCSLDQVREALSIQDRMKRMGIVPKSLAEILVEKGYVKAEQLASVGAAVPAAARPAPPRPSAARRYAPKRSLAPLAWLAVLVVLVLAGVAIVPGLLKKPDAPVVRVAEDASAAERERADREAKEELDQIGAFQRSAPDFGNGEEVARRYAAYLAKHAKKKWEIEAQDRFKAYRVQVDRLARPEFDALLQKDSDLRADGRLGDLLRLYEKFPRKYLEISDSGRTVKEKAAELRQKVREAYLRDKSETEKLLRAGRFPEALKAAEGLTANASDEQFKEIADLKARIEHESKTTSSRRRKEVSGQYLRLDGDFKKALSLREPRIAAGLIRKFLFEALPAEDAPLARVDGVDYEALRKAVEEWRPDAVVALCESGIGDPPTPEAISLGVAALLDFRSAAMVAMFLQDFDASYKAAVAAKEALDLPGLGKGRFEKREKGTVFVTAEGTLLQADTRPMTDADRVTLALKGKSPDDAEAHARAGFYYYYCCVEEHVKAYQHLSHAKACGAKGVGLYVAALYESAQAELGRMLETKFGAAEASLKERRWTPARKLLEEMLEHAGHPAVQKRRPLIEKMLFDVAEALTREKSLAELYRAKVEPAGGASVRVLYDFESREQTEAFEYVADDGERKFKGRWRLDRGGMESSLEASVLRWKTRVKGDLAVEYDLTPLEDPQNIVLDLYYNKGHARHYAVVLGFDWVGKADGDRDNTAEDRFGMPRTCVLKYPVAVDKARWVLADHWKNWTSQLVGAGKGAVWKASKGKTVRLRVERQGKAIRVLADKTPVWEGEDADYNEGDLLFFSDCRCRLDNLAITLTP